MVGEVAEWTIRESSSCFFWGGGNIQRGESTSASRSQNEVWRFCSSAVRFRKRSSLPHLHLNGFHGWQPKGIVQPKLKFHPFTPQRCVHVGCGDIITSESRGGRRLPSRADGMETCGSDMLLCGTLYFYLRHLSATLQADDVGVLNESSHFSDSWVMML